jgi:hypothetical protein
MIRFKGLDMEALAIWDLKSLTKYYREIKKDEDRVKLMAFINDEEEALELEIRINRELREELEMILSNGDDFYNPAIASIKINNKGLGYATNKAPAKLLNVKDSIYFNKEDREAFNECIKYLNLAIDELRAIYLGGIK